MKKNYRSWFFGLMIFLVGMLPIVGQQTENLQQALDQLRQSPGDTYSQYIVWQLARRSNSIKKIIEQFPLPRLDLFSDFTNAETMQQILQRETMLENDLVAPGREDWIAIEELTPFQVPAISSKEKISVDLPDMSGYVPQDHYFVYFYSFDKFAQAIDLVEEWQKPLLSQAGKAQSHNVGKKIREQLALEYNPQLRPIYNQVVEKMVVSGSDPFMREGSDVSLLFRYKTSAALLFQQRMKYNLALAQKIEGAKSGSHEYMGIAYDYVFTEDRRICSYSAYPLPGLHIRSNSKVTFEKIIRTILHKEKSLKDSKEFSHAFSVLKEQKDAFAYFSSHFMTYLHSAKLKLTERHRILCYNHLKMISHASLLYYSETGQKPESLSQLAEKQCSPGEFGSGRLVCPDGGKYSLDQFSGKCSHHGNIHFLTPVCEIPVKKVMGEEAYSYNKFCKTFSPPFSALIVGLSIGEHNYRMESVALPLMGEWQVLQTMFGESQTMNIAPGSSHSLFKLCASLDKEQWIDALKEMPRVLVTKELEQLLRKGLGQVVSLQFYDDTGSFPLDILGSVGQFVGYDRPKIDPMVLAANFFAQIFFDGSVELSIKVKDQKLVDDFLTQVDDLLSLLPHSSDFIFSKLQPENLRYIRLNLGSMFPIFGDLQTQLWGRIFWTRLDHSIFLTTKLGMLEKLIAEPKKKQAIEAHAALALYPNNWDKLLKKWDNAWIENNRRACRFNIIQLSRLVHALGLSAADEHLLEQAQQLYGLYFFCPNNGKYRIVEGKQQVVCQFHGSATSNKEKSSQQFLLSDMVKKADKVLTYMNLHEYGMRIVITVDQN